MPEFKIQFEKSIMDHTPKSQYENFITELMDGDIGDARRSRQKLPQ
jgi:hypothetical protein